MTLYAVKAGRRGYLYRGRVVRAENATVYHTVSAAQRAADQAQPRHADTLRVVPAPKRSIPSPWGDDEKAKNENSH